MRISLATVMAIGAAAVASAQTIPPPITFSDSNLVARLSPQNARMIWQKPATLRLERPERVVKATEHVPETAVVTGTVSGKYGPIVAVPIPAPASASR